MARTNPLPVRLTFFTELEKEPLAALFSNPGVIDQLLALNARVSMGILDFCDERAEVVRQLNAARVPVVAWQLLPKEKGYWYHAGNAADAVECYEEFLEWSRREGLKWDAIAIDIEPDINEIQQLLSGKLRKLFTFARRVWDTKAFAESSATYKSLVERMRTDGYTVQSYEFFFVTDERKTGSSLLARVLGVVDIPADRRVIMLYTSFFRPVGVAVLQIYARFADAVAIGITGGGVELAGFEHKDPMTWDELSRDLRFAKRCCRDVHIFSLEGCVAQDFLSRLNVFDWNRQAARAGGWTPVIYLARLIALLLLWLFARVKYAIAVTPILLWLMLYEY